MLSQVGDNPTTVRITPKQCNGPLDTWALRKQYQNSESDGMHVGLIWEVNWQNDGCI